MAQIHLVVCYDTDDGTIAVDWATTQATMQRANIFRPEGEEWDYATEEEDKIQDELIPQLDHYLEEFRLDI